MSLKRYLTIYAALWKNSVAREMSFKGNFLKGWHTAEFSCSSGFTPLPFSLQRIIILSDEWKNKKLYECDSRRKSKIRGQKSQTTNRKESNNENKMFACVHPIGGRRGIGVRVRLCSGAKWSGRVINAASCGCATSGICGSGTGASNGS